MVYGKSNHIRDKNQGHYKTIENKKLSILKQEQ